jgi:hypothetical protein
MAIQILGSLFFVKGFDILQYLIFDAKSLEVFRLQSWFSFFSIFTEISYYLVVISATGLIGLILAGAVSHYVNQKLKYNQGILVISILVVLLFNKLFTDITQIIDFRTDVLKQFSVKFLLAMGLSISVSIGFLILQLPKHLEKINYYLKVH